MNSSGDPSASELRAGRVNALLSPEVVDALALPPTPDIDLLSVHSDDETLMAFVDAISEAEWLLAVESVAARMTNCQFFLGSLVNKGISRFGEDVLGKLAKRCRKTLVDYARVARNVPPESRRDDLEFNHHRAVESLKTVGEQIHFLSLAAENNWTCAQLKAEVVAARPGGSRRPPQLHSFAVKLTNDQNDVLRVLAEIQGTTPDELLEKVITNYLEWESPFKAEDAIEVGPAVCTAAREAA